MSTSRGLIRSKALDLLRQAPHGIRYSDLMRQVQKALPQVPMNTITGNLWNLEVVAPDEVYKPARGLFRHVKFRETALPGEPKPTAARDRHKEETFYEPFADWLINELEECTRALPVGGNKFKDRWGTPDVIGVREPKKSDIIKFPTEIVSAEVKLDSAGLITAFGQACAYRLFSHKSYLVVPRDSQDDDLARLDALSRIFGIGLILFDARSPKNPSFEIRARAIKHEPDMFYVNRCMKLIEDELFT